MVDPPTYRAEPDPEFADRLERVLLQRLTASRPDRAPAVELPRAMRRSAPTPTPTIERETSSCWTPKTAPPGR